MEEATNKEAFVLNCDTGTVHRVQVFEPLVPSALWKTQCGWKFAARANRYSFCFGLQPNTRACESCSPAAPPSW